MLSTGSLVSNSTVPFGTTFTPFTFVKSTVTDFPSAISGATVSDGVTDPPLDPPVLGLLVELFTTFPFGAVISTLPVTVPSTFISTFLSVFIIISSVIVAFGFNTILSLAFAFAKASFNSSTVPTS